VIQIEHLIAIHCGGEVLTDQPAAAVRHETHTKRSKKSKRVRIDSERVYWTERRWSGRHGYRGLPARTRDVFVLHRFEELSCTSIAPIGMSVSASRSTS